MCVCRYEFVTGQGLESVPILPQSTTTPLPSLGKVSNSFQATTVIATRRLLGRSGGQTADIRSNMKSLPGMMTDAFCLLSLRFMIVFF